MAAFNPQLSVNLGDNYTTRSQGQTPNKALGYLFSGLADSISAFKSGEAARKKAADTAASNALDEGLYSGLGGLVSESLTPEPTPSLVSNRPGSMPKYGAHEILIPQEATTTVSELKRLRSSLNQGTMRQSEFDMKANKLMKEFHSKFPQFTMAEIEERFHKALGNSTAYDFFKSIRKEAEDEASKISDDEKRKKDFINQKWVMEATADPEFLLTYEKATGQKFNPNSYDEGAVRYGLSQSMYAQKQKADHLAELELLKKEDEASGLRAEQYATSDLLNLKNKLGYTVLSSAPFERLRLDQIISKGPLNILPADRVEAMAILGKWKNEVSIAKDQFWTHKLPGGTKAYSDYIRDPKKKSDIDSVLDGPLTMLSDALLNEQAGILMANKVYYDGIKDDINNKWLVEHGQSDKELELAVKTFGSKTINDWYSATTQDLIRMDDRQRALRDSVMFKIANGRPVAEILDELRYSGAAGPKDSDVILKAMNHAIEFGLSGTMNKEQTAAYFNGIIFSDENNKLLSGMKNPERILPLLINPKMTEAMKNTPMWDEYTRFTYDQAPVILRPLAKDLIDAQKYTDKYLNLSFDEKTGRFITDNPVGRKYVEPINKYLDTIQPVLEADGMDAGVFLDATLSGMEYRKIVKEGSVLTRVHDVLKKFFEQQKLEGKTPGATPGVRGEKSSQGAKPKESLASPTAEELFQGGPHQSIEGHQGKGVNAWLPKGVSATSLDSSTLLVAQFEGYIGKPKFDVNKLRVGFGSDTVTRADGSVEPVTKDTIVSKEDALRDLQRRVGEFQQEIISDVGYDAWNVLGPNQQAALTSLSYNYGSLPKSVVAAVKTGNAHAVAFAIAALQEHNKGVNRKRRLREANMFLGVPDEAGGK